MRLSFLPDFTERLFFALSAHSIGYTEECQKYTFLYFFHDTSFPSPELNFCRYLRAIQLFDMCWTRYMSMKTQAPFRQSKNPSGKRGMYTFVYLGPAPFGRHETRLAGMRVQKVQRVLRVQRVVVSPTAMSMYGCSAALVGAF